jgi:hypothetical protein
VAKKRFRLTIRSKRPCLAGVLLLVDGYLFGVEFHGGGLSGKDEE